MAEHPLMLRAYELVHHEEGCPAIGGSGDKDCRCDAVPFLDDLRTALATPEAAHGAQIGLACGAVADAVFYHVSDRNHRSKLANALVDLMQLSTPDTGRRVVANCTPTEGSEVDRLIVENARAFMAELDPVDGDRNEAERIAYDMEGALPRDLVEAGIKAGRKMEADERNAAIKRRWDDAHGSGAIAGRALAETGK